MQNYKTTITKTTETTETIEVVFPIYLKSEKLGEVCRFVSETDGIALTKSSAEKTVIDVDWYLSHREPATDQEFYEMLKVSEFNIRQVINEATLIPKAISLNEKIKRQAEYEHLLLTAGTVDHEDIRLQEDRDTEEALIYHFEKDQHE